jgi:hypothetical protein
MSLKRRALFVSFFLEALKPRAIEILEAGCAIADGIVSATTRLEVLNTEPVTEPTTTTATTKVDVAM